MRKKAHASIAHARRYLRFPLMFLFSTIIHVVLVVFAYYFFTDPPTDRRARALEVWLSEPKKPDNNSPMNKPVVSLVEIDDRERPDNAHYLSEQDSKTAKEKKAKNRAHTTTNPPSTNRGDSDYQDDELLENTDSPAQKKKIGAKSTSDPLGLHSSLPNAEAYDDNYLPNMDDGDKTQLNAWQWRHAPFFNRIKSRIGAIWSPGMQIARFDPTGMLLGHKDRVTTLAVTINGDGQLVDLTIASGSGVAYLDDEAERAIRLAAPFAFPPRELFLNGKDFSFNFSFHLQINRGFSFDFDWK